MQEERNLLTAVASQLTVIIERHQLDASLQAERDKMKSILYTIPDGVYIINWSYEIEFINPAVERDFGPVDGRKCYQYFYDRTEVCSWCRNQEILAGQEVHQESTFSKIGKTCDVFATTIINADGSLSKLALFHDITSRKRAEEEVAKSRQELQEAILQLKQTRDMLQLIIESIPLRVFWKDKDLRFLGCNTIFAQDAGFNQSQQLLGLSDFDMIWREQAELRRADDRQVIKSALAKSDIIEPQTTLSGTPKWLKTSKVPLQLSNGEVFGMLGVYDDITAIKQTEEQLKTSLAEKEVLLKELHHRVKNNLQIVASMLEMQADLIQDPRVKEMLQDCQSRIRSMALVHEALYRSSNLAQINLEDYLLSLSNSIFSSYCSGGTIQLITEIEPIPTNIETAISCGLILTELLSNALKYAFPDNRAGEIYLSLRKNTADKLVLTVKDNGVGIPAHIDFGLVDSLGLTVVGNSLGMSLITDLTQFQLDGQIVLKRDHGTEFQITFKNLDYQTRI